VDQKFKKLILLNMTGFTLNRGECWRLDADYRSQASGVTSEKVMEEEYQIGWQGRLL